MIKLVFTLRRRPDLTRDEFQAYWRDRHAPLVARHAEALRIRRYVQTHARSSEFAAAQSVARGGEPDVYDGQAELWWDSLDDVIAAASTPAGQAAAIALLEDERRFIDLERSPLWIGEEHVVVTELTSQDSAR
ncbi:MAG TPA: EthD domain-containing protein [Solirubrobacteraceae bacterium]